ncbi:MAG TPA: metallophosphoesterase [Longimicrobiaceae bacterium]|nr:metallophosphoesterase [Longimicrobiaceae bacterium]
MPDIRPVAGLMASAVVVLLAFAASSCAPGVAEPDTSDLRVAVISDLNSSYGSTEYEPAVHSAIEMIREEWRPDLVLIAGDMIAGQKPSLSDKNVRAMWEAFEHAVARPLREAGVPFAFTVGNHDASAYPAHARDRRLAMEHWRDPEHATGIGFIDRANFPLYYSFTAGDVFVLVWDASTEGTAENIEMMEWVESALNSEAAREADYRIVLGHLPLYAVAQGRNRPGEVLAHADSLRMLLERHDVDLYVSGHHHAFYPGKRGDLEMLFSGALGQGARQLLGSDADPVQTVTLLDVAAGAGLVEYTTFAYNEGKVASWERLDIRTLPDVVHGLNGSIARCDMPDIYSALTLGRTEISH